MIENIALALTCLNKKLINAIRSLFQKEKDQNKRLSARNCKWFYVHLWLEYHQRSTENINFHSRIKFENISNQNAETES